MERIVSYEFTLGLLAVWRLTHLFSKEDGPWDLVVRLRRLAGTGMVGRMLDCFYCLSVWIAVPLAFVLADRWKDRLLLWPALSGGAILLERLTASNEKTTPPFFTEDQEDPNVLRR